MLKNTSRLMFDGELVGDPANNDNSDPVKKLRGVIQNVSTYLLNEVCLKIVVDSCIIPEAPSICWHFTKPQTSFSSVDSGCGN